MPAVPNRRDATDRRAARASPSRMGQFMSDDLISTTVRAWSSRFSPSEISASTRLEPSNRDLQGFEIPLSSQLLLKRGHARVASELRCIHTPALSSGYAATAHLPKHIAGNRLQRLSTTEF